MATSTLRRLTRNDKFKDGNPSFDRIKFHCRCEEGFETLYMLIIKAESVKIFGYSVFNYSKGLSSQERILPKLETSTFKVES